VLHVIVICAFGPLVTFYRIGSAGQLFNRINDIPNYNNPEILFLGPSSTYRGFDTRIFKKAGISTFNLGSSAQTPLQTEVLMKKYLDEIAPESIVFEVYPPLFNSDGVESTADLISNDHIDGGLCKLAINSGNVKLINTLIYGIYQEYFRKIRSNFQERTVVDDDLYVSGGFVEKLKYDSFVSEEFILPVLVEISSKQLEAFDNCLKMAKDRQIPYQIVRAPLSRSANASLMNLDKFDEAMSSRGVYVDFNELMQLDDSCYFDANHLNQIGVELFDQCFIQVLDTMQLWK
jgi:hypothetical protein